MFLTVPPTFVVADAEEDRATVHRIATPIGFRFRSCSTFLYTALMKHFTVNSVTSSLRHRMLDHPGREVTLVHGDAVPTFHNKKVKSRLIQAAKHPRRAKHLLRGLPAFNEA
jgi:hypothetical protein